jgi:hypothetical protein
MTQLEKLLDQKLTAPLSELGFGKVNRLIFLREVKGVGQLIRFPTRLENQVLMFNANAAIRFERIEALLGNIDPMVPTLMLPIHLLRPNTAYLEWKLSIEGSEGLVETVITNCRLYLLPLFERWGSIESLKSQLLFETAHYLNVSGRSIILNSEVENLFFRTPPQNDGKPKSVLNPDQRVEKLAAIFALEGRADFATQLIDRELLELSKQRQSPPQIARRIRFESLKKTLLGT